MNDLQAIIICSIIYTIIGVITTKIILRLFSKPEDEKISKCINNSMVKI